MSTPERPGGRQIKPFVIGPDVGKIDGPPNKAPDRPDGMSALDDAAQRRLADDRRKQRRWFALVALMLLALTAWFFALNAVIIERSRPGSYTLRFRHGVANAEQVRYRASAVWQGPDAEQAPGRVLLRESRGDASGRPLPAELDIRRSYALDLVVEPGVAPGRHHAVIRLEQIAGPESAGDLSLPLAFTTRDDLWSNWFLLRNWLLFCLLVWGLVHLVCWLAFPVPHGALMVRHYGGSVPIPGSKSAMSRSCRLRRRRLAWLLPWLRASRPVGRLVKRAVGRGRTPPLELCFVSQDGVPQLLLTPGTRPVVRRRVYRSDSPPVPAAMSEGASVQLMTEHHEFVFEATAETLVGVRFARRPGSGAR